MKGVSLFEIHSYEKILILGELIPSKQQHERQSSKTMILVFFSVLDSV